MKKRISAFLLLPVLALLLSVSSFSANEPYISENGYLQMQVVKYNPVDFERAWANSVAVSENEMLAVGFDNNTILITDDEFKVKTAIKLEHMLYPKENLVVKLNWDENENLQINEPISDTVLLVDVNGNLLADYQAEEFEGSKGISKVNGNVYGKRASNIFMLIAPDDARDEVFKVAADGTETILFKSEKNAPYLVLACLAFFIGGHIFMGVAIYRASTKGKRYRNGKQKVNVIARYIASQEARGKSIYRFRYGVKALLTPLIVIVASMPFYMIVKYGFEAQVGLFVPFIIISVLLSLVRFIILFERYKFDGKSIVTKRILKTKRIEIPANAVFLITTALDTNNNYTSNSHIVHIIEGDAHSVSEKMYEDTFPFENYNFFKRLLKISVYDNEFVKNKFGDKWLFSFTYDPVSTIRIFQQQKRQVIIAESLLSSTPIKEDGFELFVNRGH